MLTNNLLFILRRFGRQKVNTLFHIIGLTIGLSVCLIIALFIRHELTYDQYHENADRIFRVTSIWSDGGEEDKGYGNVVPLAPALREAIPELEYVTRVYPKNEAQIEINANKKFSQQNILIAESDFLNIFDVEVLAGNAYEALRQPYQALLTKTTAQKFFGNENPIGKTFKYKNEFTITVGGILEDFPNNTHLQASMLISFYDDPEFIGMPTDSWFFTTDVSTYAMLAEGQTLENVRASVKAVFDQNTNVDPEETERLDGYLQPLNMIHLEPEWEGGGDWVNAISPSWLWFFGGVGLAILFLACVNFINLSTAQALTRAKEVGVRKVVGAGRKQLISQFVGEAFLLILISSCLAIFVVNMSLSTVNSLLSKELTLSSIFGPGFILLFLVSIVSISVLTGIYPAILTSKFQPIVALKSSVNSSDKNSAFFRKGLVVTQFAISIALLVSLLFMSQQMDYFFNKELGFDKDNVVVVANPETDKNAVFGTELKKIPEIKQVSFSGNAPGIEYNWITVMSEKSLDDPGRKDVNVVFADEAFYELYDIQPIAGRVSLAKDTLAISSTLAKELHSPKLVVNETLVREMGYASADAAIGKKFNFGINNWKGEIVGVVPDFHNASLHEAVLPVMMFAFPKYHRKTGIKISANSDVPAVLTAIKSAWEKTHPDKIYDYQFLDERIQHNYETESQLYALFKLFAGLAMLISCLGLWGLATFTAHQRTKEIGIRKVLGASTTNLLGLLSKDFLLLVLIALIIAAPIAWYGMNQWLQNFAYRIDIQWWVFMLAGIVAVMIALLTIGTQSLRAALSNPVESLRQE